MSKVFIKPQAPIIGANGNIFNLMGIASRYLKYDGYIKEANEMVTRVTSSDSYEEALRIITEYIEPCEMWELDEEYSSK